MVYYSVTAFGRKHQPKGFGMLDCKELVGDLEGALSAHPHVVLFYGSDAEYNAAYAAIRCEGKYGMFPHKGRKGGHIIVRLLDSDVLWRNGFAYYVNV